MSSRRPERADPEGTAPASGDGSPAQSSLPPWLQAQTVRLVVSGLMTVYFLGLLFDLRGYPVALAVEAVVLVLVGLVLLLTAIWWSPTGARAAPPRARVFLVLAILALLAQLVGVVVESANPNDLANNAASLLLLFVLLVNTLG